MDPSAPQPTSLSDLPPDVVNFNDGPRLVWTTLLMTAVSTIVVAIRFIFRCRAPSGLRTGHRIGWDDWFILVALLMLWGFTATGVAGVYKGGMGRYLVVNMINGPQYLANTLLLFYISEYFYFTCVLFIKASVLAMYLRIFPTRFIKIGVYVLGTYVVLLWVASIFVVIFQCTPVQKAYNPYIKEGWCLSIVSWFLGAAIPNIISEILILILPTREIWKLQVPRPQKLAICGVFAVGLLVVICSALRIHGLVDFDEENQADLTRDIAHGWILTCAEPLVAIVAACLPTMTPLLRFIFGKAFASRHSNAKDALKPGREIVTIGGSGATGSSGLKSKEMGSRSERFTDIARSLHSISDGEGNNASDMPVTPVSWPRTGHNPLGNQVVISGPHAASVPEIPQPPSIAVQRDFRWSAEIAPWNDVEDGAPQSGANNSGNLKAE
ncbi:hypothetical protein B0T16DRAFT_452461 [Cercophora newfieldiana]|uniref:Rhodopsin domain-containing protein n=1 Tax=Cercophora newfieldiana TaxID=92897 RepID=A0AA39YQT7_9PEZI|nr:hypothetical protein B0T16DRAFT_452461 [Cercophora newfieldiana]